MAFIKGFYDITNPSGSSDFAKQLGLKNLGMTVFTLNKGEGFDHFHNHREQEEVYFCLNGTATLLTRENPSGDSPEDSMIPIGPGEIVRVAPHTLRAIGNIESDTCTVLVAGAMPHTYPAGFGHHDVIADVLSIVGRGETGFVMPSGKDDSAPEMQEPAC